MHLSSINHFRGLAIFIIVAGHCMELADFHYVSVYGVTLSNLVTGGTSLFVFISGFLFHHVFIKNFHYVTFMLKKVKYVLLPYIIMSFLPLLYVAYFGNLAGVDLSDKVFKFCYGLFTGYLLPAYWYIPFAMILFLISPFHIWFVRQNKSSKIMITVALFFVSLFLHRAGKTVGVPVIQSVVYYTPVYLLGILVSEFKHEVFKFLERKVLLLFGLTVLIALIQSFIGHEGNYCKDPFVYGGIDLMLIQKVLLVLFVWALFMKYEGREFKLLDLFAKNSFGIFFLHAILLMIYTKVKDLTGYTFEGNSFFNYLLVSLTVFITSYYLVVLIKKVIPGYSRFVIGS